MVKISIEPRPPVNQGIDTNNTTVLRHTQIYETLLSHVTEGSGNAYLSLNPYGTAPLSGYVGVWATSTSPIRVQISDDIGSVPIDYVYTPVVGANLVPLAGLSPASANQLVVTIPGVGAVSTVILTNPLPPTDAEIEPPTMNGFPIFEVTSPMANPPATINQLYFAAFIDRYNVGLDHNGTVRWYTTHEILAWNLARISNGNFLSTDSVHGDYKLMYEFDIVGRVHNVFILDNQCHHSIEQMPNGNIIFPSEYSEISNSETPEEHTIEDGISIMDLSTGLEVAYYDARESLDVNRVPRPITPTQTNDWIHINHCYYDSVNDLIVGSGRHQAVYGINYDTGELVFVMAPHDGWSEEYQQYLLTPVDELGVPLYDFSDVLEIDRADKEFWTWGQHSVIKIPNDTTGIVEFMVFNNGNYRSREDSLSLLPNDNYSDIGRYRINLNQMTIMRLFEYGKDEVGAAGYSSFTSSVRILDNGNYLINFGGVRLDENERVLTVQPGYSDLIDPLDGSGVQSRLLLQEVIPDTKEVALEIATTSGRLKTFEEYGSGYRYDVNSFCVDKMPMIL